MFKGGEPAVSAKGKKKEKQKRKRERALAQAEAGGATPGVGDGATGTEVEKEPEEELRPISGTGRVSSSGTAVHGHDTKFMDEVHSGDAIIITHPTT